MDRAEAKASWERKTPEEKKASMDRLDGEIGEKGAEAIKKAFEKAFKYINEMRESERIAGETT